MIFFVFHFVEKVRSREVLREGKEDLRRHIQYPRPPFTYISYLVTSLFILARRLLLIYLSISPYTRNTRRYICAAAQNVGTRLTPLASSR